MDAVNCSREERWIVGGVMERSKEEGWQRPVKGGHETARFTPGYGGPVKVSTVCVKECCVSERLDAEAVRGDGEE